MIKITFLLVGKVKDEYLSKIIDKYVVMLSKYAKIELKFLEEAYIQNENSTSEIEKALSIEQNTILKNIKNTDCVFLLDSLGKEFDSIELSKYLNSYFQYNSSIVFLIGSSHGFSKQIKSMFKNKISLSKLTLTHPLALTFILEQVFRSFKIINNETYHK